MLSAPGRHRKVERRKLPRIPLAIPVRYATEDGQVGIGALIDVHEKGAGLLVPHIALDALHVWLQFLWFDDRIGLQGRVVFVRETPDGFHLGLQLHLIHPDSVEFLTNLLIPLGLRKFRLDRKRAISFLSALLPGKDSWLFRERRRYLPVLVEQGPLKVWAITEERNDEGAVLLLPQLPQEGTPVRMTTLGGSVTNEAAVVRSETLKLVPVELFRVAVVYEKELVRPAERAKQDPTPLQHSEVR